MVLLPGELASVLPVQGSRQHEVLRAVSWDRHQLSYFLVFQGTFFSPTILAKASWVYPIVRFLSTQKGWHMSLILFMFAFIFILSCKKEELNSFDG